jgi:small subunit ribosomal protein S17
MEKTVVVSVTRLSRHPRYEKVLRKTKKYKAQSDVKIAPGTEVVIEESRPKSKNKHWRVSGLAEEKK